MMQSEKKGAQVDLVGGEYPEKRGKKAFEFTRRPDGNADKGTDRSTDKNKCTDKDKRIDNDKSKKDEESKIAKTNIWLCPSKKTTVLVVDNHTSIHFSFIPYCYGSLH